MMEEAWDRGWSSAVEKWVCSGHVEDYALEELIAENATSTICSYCNRQADEPFAAELDLVIERIATGLKHEWGNADDEEVPWEGGYAGTTYDTYDLLVEIVDGPLNHSDLITDVVNALPDHRWAQRDYFRLLPHQRLQYGWEDFGRIVKHRRRYFFSDHVPDEDEDDPDYIAPGAMLDELGAAIRAAGLLRVLPAEFSVFRVRSDRHGATFARAGEIGTAPLECLKSSGRMAPAGIPIFYSAFDADTAVVEARHADPEANAFSIGQFELREPLLVVDLSEERNVPSLFDERAGHLRSAFIFLRFFANAIAEPYVRDERIHIEYVPTQVVTEWLRTRFDAQHDQPVMGVLYKSSRLPGGVNAALFLDNAGACDPEEAAQDHDAMLVMSGSRAVID
jgi:hypothetical protein